MNICIYGASSAELKKIYYEKTEELGQLMGNVATALFSEVEKRD